MNINTLEACLSRLMQPPQGTEAFLQVRGIALWIKHEWLVLFLCMKISINLVREGVQSVLQSPSSKVK